MIAVLIKYKHILKWCLLILVIAFVGRFIWESDVEIIGDYLRQMPGTFGMLIALSFGAYLCATIAWRLCMGADGRRASLSQLFMVRHIGEVLSVFNPTSVIAGETLKAYYLSKNSISNQTAVSSILISRILIILSAIMMIVISAVYLTSQAVDLTDRMPLVAIVGSMIVAFGYMLARLLLHSKLYLYRLLKALQTKVGTKYISDPVIENIREINQTSYTFYHSHRTAFVMAFVLSAIHWALGAAEFYVILQALDSDISLINALAIEMGVILFKTVGAIVPGQIGVEEYANKVMLGMIGIVSNEVWLVVSIMRRARQLFWVAVAFVFYLLLRKNKEDQSATDLRNLPNQSTSSPPKST